jgi:hypothetical protein
MKAYIEEKKENVFVPINLTVEIKTIEEFTELLLRLNMPLSLLNIPENDSWLPGAFDVLKNISRTQVLWETLEEHRAANGYLK